MKSIYILIVLVFTLAACGSDQGADSTQAGGEQELPPPPRPDEQIAGLDAFVDSMLTAEGLEQLVKLDENEPGIRIERTGAFGAGENYVLTESSNSSFTNQESRFVVKAGTLVYSKHRMLRKRCGHVDDVCLTESRQYYKNQQLIWSESRHLKMSVQQTQGEIGMTMFQLLDSVPFQVIPNLRSSTELYANEMMMVRDVLEILRQPEASEPRMIRVDSLEN